MIAVATGRVFEDCGDRMGSGWWWVMGMGWLVFLAAHDVLDERFARGEIDEEEYRRRRDALRS